MSCEGQSKSEPESQPKIYTYKWDSAMEVNRMEVTGKYWKFIHRFFPD